MKPRLIRPSFFVWMIAPLVAFGLYIVAGLPHVIWSYTFRDDGQGNDPFAARHYISCTFIGPYGAFEVAAKNGKCGWVQFFTSSQGKSFTQR